MRTFERYIGDLTELPFKIVENTKYQFNIIDQFSKFAFSYLLENKDSNKIFECIKECFNKYGVPQEFGTENSKEFCNGKIKNFLESKHIKFIHGKGYNPQSQWYVERLDRLLNIN